MLQELSNTEGIGVTVLENANEFLEDGRLKLIWNPDSYPQINYYLIAHKKQKVFFESMKKLF